MKNTHYQRKFERLVDIPPADPAIRRFGEWLPVNQDFYQGFRGWLKASSYSPSAINLYGVAARQAIGFIDKPYWQIDPKADVECFWNHLQTRPIQVSTLDGYRKGLAKLAEYLRFRCYKSPAPKTINWAYFISPLPGWLQEDIRDFIAFCMRNWTIDRQVERANDLLSLLTRPLRWMATRSALQEIRDLTPEAWYAYLDERLAKGINPKTVNRELAAVKHLIFYLREHEQPVSERFLLLDYLDETKDLPRDVPLEQLRALQKEIQDQAASPNAGVRRMGRMDLAWFLLMLHSGLRTGEVRYLRQADIDWEGRRVRIEQSKGLKDRFVFLSQTTIEALKAYLEMRGPAEALPDQLFVFRHQPLSKTYCMERLRTLGKRCGVSIKPHQLRHCNATLLLNSGAPVLTVQALLGHKWVDTTLGYARLYDGTVAADYYQAMAVIEQRLALPEDCLVEPPGVGQLLALVDSLRDGLLNEKQLGIVRQLRIGLSALAQREDIMNDVKVQ